MPTFIYVRDFHTTSFSYTPDVAISIDDVWETKLAACGAHESQVVECNPQLEGVLDEVLASKQRQREFLVHNTYPFSKITPDNRLALDKWYGTSRAAGVTYVEAFEIAEYGRQLQEGQMREVFPMLPSNPMSGSTECVDTGTALGEATWLTGPRSEWNRGPAGTRQPLPCRPPT